MGGYSKVTKASTAKSAPLIIHCANCGKEIRPNAMGISCDCVWRDGIYYCMECNGKVKAKG